MIHEISNDAQEFGKVSC